MIAMIDSSQHFSAVDSFTLQVTIVYEHFASGVRAKGFAERLAEQLGGACQLSESLWRSDLLESSATAAEIARSAADCDYLILSLRGDRVLPRATRQWIERWLAGAADRGKGLILLSDPSLAEWQALARTRHDLRTACALNGVAFFSHAVALARESAPDLIFSDQRCQPALLEA